MNLCKICHQDSKKHSKKLWEQHSKIQFCEFCQKKGSKHSKKLWEMHKLAVKKGRYCPRHHKEENLYPLTLGFARTRIVRVCTLKADPPNDKELIPIYMSCAECSLYLGSREEDYADILGGMCLECFMEVTEQIEM